MKRYKDGFSVIEIIMAVTIICLIGTVGWLYWSSTVNKTSDTNKTSASKETDNSTKAQNSPKDETKDGTPIGWIRYSSPTYSFSFAHPQKWVVTGSEQGGPSWYVVRIYTNGQKPGELNSDADIYISSTSVKSLNDVLKEKNEFLASPGIQVISRSDTQLGGNLAKEFRYKQPSGNIERLYVVSANNYIFELPRIREDDSGISNSGGISASDYDTLLKSFRFDKN